MFKWLIGAALALTMGAVSALENIPPKVVEFFEESVWMVSDKTGFGSAFHIAPTFLITNKHVAENFADGGGLMQKRTGFATHRVEVVALSNLYDLALLYCPTCIGLDPPLLKIDDTWFEAGRATYGGGYGYGLFAVHAGYISMFHWGKMRWITDSIAQPGDSGSPQIVVDSDGSLRLVGVRTSGWASVVTLEPAGGVAGFLRRIGW